MNINETISIYNRHTVAEEVVLRIDARILSPYIVSIYSQVRTTSPFQWVLLTERDYIVPFNELQHPFSELFQEDGRQVSINYS